MNPRKKQFCYKKQINGKGRFGCVELELTNSNYKSKVIDKCKWKDWNSNFKETPFLNSIKVYLLNSIQYIIQNYNSSYNFEIKLIDIKILPVDTLPSHLLASTIIGVFELIGESLNDTDIKQIDNFITDNNNIDFPDYKELILITLNRNKLIKIRNH